MKAIWHDEVIAQSDATIVVEGNHYFARDSVNMDLLKPISHTSFCPWKGEASYFDIVVDGKTNAAAAWSYVDPKEKAQPIQGYIAFYPSVLISE